MKLHFQFLSEHMLQEDSPSNARKYYNRLMQSHVSINIYQIRQFQMTMSHCGFNLLTLMMAATLSTTLALHKVRK